MANYARRATLAASINELAPAPHETVLLSDVMRHRQAFTQMIEAWQEDASLEKILTGAATCAAIGCNAPMAKVLEVRENTSLLFVKGQFGMGEEAIGRSAGAVETSNPAGEALAKGKPVIEGDVRRRLEEKLPALLAEYKVVTSVNLPLINHGGAYGILEVDYREPTVVGALEMSFLASVAGALAESIEKYRARSTLAADRDAKIDLLREQQHRIRNNFQLIVTMLQRNGIQAKDPQVRKSFRDVERRVFAMASLYDHLLGLTEHGEEVDLGRYLASMGDNFHDFYALRDNGVTLELNLQSGFFITLDACTAIGTVVNELVANAVEHAFDGVSGSIKIALSRDAAGAFTVSVSDDGRGFIANAQENIGLRTCRRMIENIGGQLQCRPTPDRGTLCEITLAT